MTILVSTIEARRTPRRSVVVASTIVTIGFMVGVSPSAAFNTNPLQNVASMGLLYGFLSSLLAAVHAVMRKTQVKREITIVQLAYNNNLLGSVLLVPLIIFNGEFSKSRDMSLDREHLVVFLVGSFVTGLFGLFLSLAGLLSIKVTSPVAHMFSNVCVFLFCVTSSGISHAYLGGT
jgi:GDP-fucose transporter C1